MARQQPIELFMPPNMLKAKVGTGTPGLDMAAIKRAETAMDGMRGGFAEWAAADVDKLMTARAQFANDGDTVARAALLRAVHDMKGQATTYDFPMIARVAGSLSKLIGELCEKKELPSGLIDAQFNAIKVIYRDRVMDTSNKMAQMLSSELEKQVEAALK
jgi:chemotaxis protein histidine kinase CheA